MARLESRDDIRKKINERKKNMKDLDVRMQKVVRDKEQIAKAVEELKLTTTKDGVMKMKEEINKAAKRTKDKFKEHNGKLNQKINECDESKGKLEQKTSAAKKNFGKIQEAKGQIKQATQAKGDLESAKAAAKSDRIFTEGEEKRQEAFKNKSKGRRDKQRNTLNGIQLPWKNIG